MWLNDVWKKQRQKTKMDLTLILCSKHTKKYELKHLWHSQKLSEPFFLRKAFFSVWRQWKEITSLIPPTVSGPKPHLLVNKMTNAYFHNYHLNVYKPELVPWILDPDAGGMTAVGKQSTEISKNKALKTSHKTKVRWKILLV